MLADAAREALRTGAEVLMTREEPGVEERRRDGPAPRANDGWRQLDSVEDPSDDEPAGKAGFFERLGKLLNLHPRGPHGT